MKVESRSTPVISQRLRSDLLLALVALIWGSAFVAQRSTANNLGVFWFTGLRFLLGAAVLVPLAIKSGRVARGSLKWMLLAGLALFIAANLQQLGLRYTTAGNAGFITGLYVVFVPFILVVFLRQTLHLSVWVAAALAIVGLLLLSTGGNLRLKPGDAIELAGAVFWALHIVIISYAVQKVDLMHLSVGQYLVNGALNVAAGLIFEPNGLTGLGQSWWALAYTGFLSVGLGYTLQSVGQKHAPSTDAALILSLEAVFAVVFGYFLLNETLNGIQAAGCVFIMAAILLVQFWKR